MLTVLIYKQFKSKLRSSVLVVGYILSPPFIRIEVYKNKNILNIYLITKKEFGVYSNS